MGPLNSVFLKQTLGFEGVIPLLSYQRKWGGGEGKTEKPIREPNKWLIYFLRCGFPIVSKRLQNLHFHWWLKETTWKDFFLKKFS